MSEADLNNLAGLEIEMKVEEAEENTAGEVEAKENTAGEVEAEENAAGAAEAEENAALIKVVVASSATNKKKIDDFEDLIDHDHSDPPRTFRFDSSLPASRPPETCERIVNQARRVASEQGGYRVDRATHSINIPVLIFPENPESPRQMKSDTISLRLGTSKRRGIICPTKTEKERILRACQNTDTVDTLRHYHVTMVAFREIQCVMIFPYPLLNRHKIVLLCVKDHIQTFNEGEIHAFKVNLIHSPGALTKSQTFVTKLIFRGLFDKIEGIYTEDIIECLFQVRSSSRKRSRPPAVEESEESESDDPDNGGRGSSSGTAAKRRSTMGGKVMMAGKHLVEESITEADVTMSIFMDELLDADAVATFPVPVLCYLTRFIVDIRGIMSEDDFQTEFSAVGDAQQLDVEKAEWMMTEYISCPGMKKLMKQMKTFKERLNL
ncbi:MAG: hypothetical protein ACO35C_03820 [Pontimonas sp.]